MKDLIQAPLSSFGMRGDISMHHSICMSRILGKEHAYVHNFSFDDYFHSFTMNMQAIALRRIIIPYKIHGQIWAIKISEHGHSLGRQREILYHCGFIPKAPNISHTFSHVEMTWKQIKWWGNHLPYHYLMQLGYLLRWFHMWDYDAPPFVQIYVCMYLVLIPYIDDVLILFMGMF